MSKLGRKSSQGGTEVGGSGRDPAGLHEDTVRVMVRKKLSDHPAPDGVEVLELRFCGLRLVDRRIGGRLSYI